MSMGLTSPPDGISGGPPLRLEMKGEASETTCCGVRATSKLATAPVMFSWRCGIILALAIMLAHMGGVLAVAMALWVTRSSRYPDINLGLARISGFVIAAIGLWRLGRHLGGYGEHEEGSRVGPIDLGNRDLIGLGLAGGLVRCWDAVILILLAEAVGRLALGLALLTAFSLGMASVLVAAGVIAARLQGFIRRRDREGVWVRRLGLLSASTLTAIGLYLFL
jgi:nickel/cobalt exporter